MVDGIPINQVMQVDPQGKNPSTGKYLLVEDPKSGAVQFNVPKNLQNRPRTIQLIPGGAYTGVPMQILHEPLLVPGQVDTPDQCTAPAHVIEIVAPQGQ